ncbi:hypothetical protein [Streptomyces sp. NPDC059816]|uniref:hypothetical protein n=1 Tax=Streptomyces sp. NPDC059816 TaxID=3346960 RepID=UPI00366495BF
MEEPTAPPVGSEVPPTSAVPPFPPVRIRGGLPPLRRITRHGRRAAAVCLVATAVALLSLEPRLPPAGADGKAHPAAPREHQPAQERPAVADWVRAPVRIADPAVARLLKRGDRIDVIATDGTPSGRSGRVVAAGVRVVELPPTADGAAEGGVLVVLATTRSAAARLAGTSGSRLAVVLR